MATDGTSASQVRPDRGEGVETLEVVPEDRGCRFNIFCHGARAAVAIWKWGAAQWNLLSSGLLQVANTIWDLVQGCFANVVDIFLALKDLISKAAALYSDPVGFVQEQIDVIRQMISALREDPGDFVTVALEGVFEKELWETSRTQWIGKFGCQLAAAFFTGGGSLITKVGGAAKLARKISDFLSSRGRPGRVDGDAIPDGSRRDRDGRDDDDPNDGDELAADAPSCTINSFPSGTNVRMANGGLTPIEHVSPGDRVLAADPVSGQWSSQLVVDQWSHIDDGRMATVYLADGGQVTATDHHKFWVASAMAWVELEDVQVGDHLLTPLGVAPVAAVVVYPAAETLVWELDTAGPDTFTVHTGTADVLVHNAPRCPLDAGSRNRINDLDPPPSQAEIDAWNNYIDRKGLEGDGVQILTPEDWRQRRNDLIESRGAGSAFERAELQRLGLDKDTRQFGDDPGFIPDGLTDVDGNPIPRRNPDGTPYELPDLEPVNFTEVKNVNYLPDTGNVSAMLDYLRDARAGGFDLIINPDTDLSAGGTVNANP